MPGRITELSETQIVADLRADRRRQAAATTSVQMPQPAKDTFTVAATPATTYQLTAIPYQGTGGSSLNLSLNGVELVEGVDYTVNYTTAVVTVSATLTGTPTPADVVTAAYWTTGDLIAASGIVDTGAITDTFNRVNSTSLGTTSDGTKTWADRSGNAVGPIGIITNQARLQPTDVGFRIATITPGALTGSVQVTVTDSTTTNRAGGVIFRYQDATNYWLAQVSNGSLTLSHNPSPGQVYTGTGADGDIIKVTYDATTVTLFRNGTQVYTRSDAALASSADVGIYIFNGLGPGGAVDDWSWTA